MTDLNKIINEQRERIAELEQENALLLVKTLPECNCEGLQERIAELEQCLVEVTSGATGQAPCAKYCEARATEIEMRKLRAENAELNEQLENERMITMKRFVETGRADQFAIQQQIKVLEDLLGRVCPVSGPVLLDNKSRSVIYGFIEELRQHAKDGK